MLFNLALTLFAVLGFSCAPQKGPQEKSFWIWFQSNQEALLKVKSGREEICNELTRQMKGLNPNLVYEFGPVGNDRREFTISADGIKESFPAVEALYAAAPVLPKWKILKFRQRREPVGISLRGTSVEADSVAVAVKKVGEKADVIVYIPGAPENDRDIYGSIAFLMLDQTLGEYDVETLIGEVQIMPASRALEKTYSLKELPKVIDGMFVH
jgi:hypothetical protein